MADTVRNPILIGQAEEIDTLQPEVRAMLAKPGLYIAVDPSAPEISYVLGVQEAGQLCFLNPSDPVNAEQLRQPLTIHGPYRHDRPAPLKAADLRRAAGFLDGERDDDCVIIEDEAKRIAEGLRALAEQGFA